MQICSPILFFILFYCCRRYSCSSLRFNSISFHFSFCSMHLLFFIRFSITSSPSCTKCIQPYSLTQDMSTLFFLKYINLHSTKLLWKPLSLTHTHQLKRLQYSTLCITFNFCYRSIDKWYTRRMLRAPSSCKSLKRGEAKSKKYWEKFTVAT